MSSTQTGTRPAPILPKRRLPDVPSAQLSLADTVAVFELNRLPDEVQRYLGAVAVFELETGRRPDYRSETFELGAIGTAGRDVSRG
jgi:hypothetical protein